MPSLRRSRGLTKKVNRAIVQELIRQRKRRKKKTKRDYLYVSPAKDQRSVPANHLITHFVKRGQE